MTNSERVKEDVNSLSTSHVCVDFSILGKMDMCEQLDSAYLQHKIKVNKGEYKNCHILRRLIICIKLELALRGHDETLTSENQGVYVGLITQLDAMLEVYMKGSQVFKDVS